MPENKQHDLVYQHFYKTLGGGAWYSPIMMTCRADVLAWIVHLAEVGLEAKRKALAETPIPQRNADAIVDLISSWQLDLEAFAHSVVEGHEIKGDSGKNFKGKGRKKKAK